MRSDKGRASVGGSTGHARETGQTCACGVTGVLCIQRVPNLVVDACSVRTWRGQIVTARECTLGTLGLKVAFWAGVKLAICSIQQAAAV